MDHVSGQVATIVEAKGVPDTVYLLEDVDPSRVLADTPYVVQIETEECAGQDFVDDLMADQGYGLARVTGGQFV